jgi:hypothetical protein
MERFKYDEIGKSITLIDLENNYSVIAIANWSKNKDNFKVTLYLKSNDIDVWSLIEEKEKINFNSDVKSIRSDIARYITQLSIEGFFEKYIKRYEYELRCFDIGHDILEKEKVNV